MELWAIKHLPSDTYLPAPRGRGGRGGTRVEIGGPGLPRLFGNETSAKAALRWWLGGEVHVRHSSYDGEGDEDWSVKPRPDRKAEDMQIVCLSLTERKAA